MTSGFKLQNKKVFVAGHNGMVGGAVSKALGAKDCILLQANRNDLDLRRQTDVEEWFAQHRPDAVVLAAAKVGGILANDTYPADFIYDNLMIETNVIHAAYKTGVEKFLFLGSSCIYPREATQPICEDALLSGPLEKTNEAYATAKIAGIKLCQYYRKQYGCDFFSAMPCNLYGPGDSYDENNSHVIPALIMKMLAAKEQGQKVLELWGTGKPLREFLYVDDLATALACLLEQDCEEDLYNIGYGDDVTIAELAAMIAEATGFDGEIKFNPDMPDGTMRKLMDSGRIKALGWKPETDLQTGLQRAVADYRMRYGDLKHAA